KEAQVRAGCHILGGWAEGGRLVVLLLWLVRVDNGEVPGLVKALPEDLGCDYRALSDDPAATAPVLPEPVRAALREGEAPAETASQAARQEPRPPISGTSRTAGDVLERLNALARRLVEECCRADSGEAAAVWAEAKCR